MEGVLIPLIAMTTLFVAFPWIILHYITKWKTAATITNEDEQLLEDLYQMARRLDDRMDTVERIISADNPDWRPARLTSAADHDDPALVHLEQLRKERIQS